MFAVEIQGWQVGYNKVASTQIIQRIAGLGLQDAYHSTHEILEGLPVTLQVSDLHTAQQLVDELMQIGANARLVPSK